LAAAPFLEEFGHLFSRSELAPARLGLKLADLREGLGVREHVEGLLDRGEVFGEMSTAAGWPCLVMVTRAWVASTSATSSERRFRASARGSSSIAISTGRNLA
jgi:hypothetical protein